MSVDIRDVTLRDGLQLTGSLIPTAEKVAIIRELIRLGMPAIEVGSLARPDLVPPLANTMDVVARLTPEELERCWVWIATPRHARRAAEAGIRHMQYCLSVSPAHNRANIGRDPEDSMSALPEVLEIAGSNGADVQLCLATAFTCPFTGDVDPRAVLELVDDPRAVGVTDVVICDTIGQATPDRVADLVGTVSDRGDGRGLVFHGHDTWGLGVANAIAAVSAGATTIDGSLGGLGGCPFAPGASGNTATEDLVFALRPDWLSPQVFADLVRLGQSVVTAAGETSASRAEKASRLTPATFPWALAAHPSAAR